MTIASGLGAMLDGLEGKTSKAISSNGGKKMQQVSLYLPMPLYERLRKVQIDTYESSMNDVIKAALKLYMALVEEKKLGSEVVVMADDGTRTKYPIFVD